MSDGPEWFAPKRYGFGTSLPISWQGWLITILFAALVVAASMKWSDRPAFCVAVVAPLSIILVVSSAWTTRGGWKWRWGSDD